MGRRLVSLLSADSMNSSSSETAKEVWDQWPASTLGHRLLSADATTVLWHVSALVSISPARKKTSSCLSEDASESSGSTTDAAWSHDHFLDRVKCRRRGRRCECISRTFGGWMLMSSTATCVWITCDDEGSSLWPSLRVVGVQTDLSGKAST